MAHDFWIEPSDFHPQVDQRVALPLRVGHGSSAEPVPRQAARMVRYVALAPDGEERQVRGVEGVEPAGFLVPDQAGLWMVGYRSNDARSELTADRFTSYLEEEGLDWVIARRTETGRADQVGVENYSRSVKSLLLVGAEPARIDPAVLERPLGLPLELVPEGNPYTTSAEGAVSFRLLADGEPAAGIRVDAELLGQDGPSRQHAVTDTHGRVALTLDAPGAWIVTAVRMTEAPAGSGADWQSVWTSLTFERP